MDYYSARLLFIILVEDGKARKKNQYDESVIVLKAKNRNHAFRRALAVGKAHEAQYNNIHGQRVRWALVEVTNLDYIGQEIDACEVASRLHSRVSKKAISPKQRFSPEKSKPGPSFS